MHSVGLMHRDFKPHNLLLRDRYLTIKIGDFGEVGEVKQTMTNCKGSAPWMAPEVFKGKLYSTACDVYSLGIILWQMVTRRYPYPGITAFTILWNTAQGTRPNKVECHPLLWKMIERMWAMDPNVRPEMTHVVEYASSMMKVYSGYNEPLIDTQANKRSPNPLFGSNRRSTGQTMMARGHRRGRSDDSALINTATGTSTSEASSGISTPRTSQPPERRTTDATGRSHSFAYPQQQVEAQTSRGGQTPVEPVNNGEIDVGRIVDTHLKPIEPIYGDAESEEKYNMHAAFAYSLHDTKEQADALTKEKHRLISRISDTMEVGKLLKRKAFLEKMMLDCYSKTDNGQAKGKARTPTSPRME
ncbi:hypothetical protein PFISCL1PPCAC_28375 [Pristionchus fissidentatus]|uniref:Protein kinase domain-containing protein n=1 Tax=Pristionchus fissidentatus TaxID=1538716 RepID=A0AAV5X335_9BILA|nr:hypothetical protein PFISCL1PPCAC_28375 [Pristionchus fissidentatus]